MSMMRSCESVAGVKRGSRWMDASCSEVRQLVETAWLVGDSGRTDIARLLPYIYRRQGAKCRGVSQSATMPLTTSLSVMIGLVVR